MVPFGSIAFSSSPWQVRSLRVAHLHELMVLLHLLLVGSIGLNRDLSKKAARMQFPPNRVDVDCFEGCCHWHQDEAVQGQAAFEEAWTMAHATTEGPAACCAKNLSGTSWIIVLHSSK